MRGLARLLESTPTSDGTEFWRYVLFRMLAKRDQQLADHALTKLKAVEWIHFLADIHTTCGDRVGRDGHNTPAIMDPTLQAWVQYLSIHSTAVAHLEKICMNSHLFHDASCRVAMNFEGKPRAHS